jgi:glycosyltransferase involved in cell wall biosynthesis
MNSKPALTIAIPTVNRARLVARAVESALAQTAENIEILVSDNGSADDTPAVLARFHDSRLRHFRHEHTVSAKAHGNFLLEQARGEYFLGLSDDDYIDANFCVRVLALVKRRPGLAFIYTGCCIHYADVDVPCLTGPETEPGTTFLAAFFSGQREVCWCACVTRVSDLRAIGTIPDGRIFGDMFYWTKLAFNGTVGCVTEPLSHYTFMTSDNLSSGVPAPTWARETRLLADEVLSKFALLNSGVALAALVKDCKKFVARSTANQLIWTALRGLSTRSLVADLQQCLPFLGPVPVVWPRALSAIFLPRWLLRRLVLRGAAARTSVRKRVAG